MTPRKTKRTVCKRERNNDQWPSYRWTQTGAVSSTVVTVTVETAPYRSNLELDRAIIYGVALMGEWRAYPDIRYTGTGRDGTGRDGKPYTSLSDSRVFAEFRSCVKVEVAVLGSVLMSLTVSMDVKQH